MSGEPVSLRTLNRFASGSRFSFRNHRKLRTVPNGDNPDNISRNSVKETVGRDNQLAMGKLRELRNLAAGFGELFEPP